MGGLTPVPAFDRALESTLRRDSAIVAASLGALVVLAWLYLGVDARRMSHMAMTMPGMPEPFVLVLAMWSIMMVGMMLPSAAPTILLYARLARGHRARGSVLPTTWVFTAGYLAVWAAFSVAAALLQTLLARSGLVTPMLSSASHLLSAGILIAAGVYQLLPVKRACLAKCREPMPFLMMHWRSGTLGALRMGALHGATCVGCCWVLMLLLFVAGVMNLAWVALITAFVLAEKLLPGERMVSGLAAVALAGTGLWLLVAGA